MRSNRFGLLVMGVCLLVGWSVVALGRTQGAEQVPPAAPAASPSQESPQGQSGSAGQAADKKAAKVFSVDTKTDPFQVPEGTPERLIDYIRGLPEAAGEDRHTPKYYRALAEASRRILAGKPEPSQAQIGAQVRVQSLAALEAANDPKAAEELAALPGDLEKQGQAALAHEITRILWQIRMNRAMRASPDDLEKVITEFRQWVGIKPEASDLQLAMETAHLLEAMGKREAAALAYQEYAKLFATLEQPELASMLKLMEGAGRRLGSIGKKMEVEGKTLDGQVLDWSKYQDKVVLVVFWATWCGPCRAETPHIKKLYEGYHDRGLEVIGISLDQQVEEVQQYVREVAIPWTILFSGQVGGADGGDPMAIKYGIIGIPAMMLVGKDGNVAALDLRGPKLDEELARLLGPLPPEKPETKPTPGQ